MIHPTATVDSQASIDESVVIGPYCVVGADVEIGSGTELMSHSTVLGPTQLGKNNVIHPHAVIGGNPQDLSYQEKDRAQSRLVVGDRNVFREYVTINRGTMKEEGQTVVGSDNLVMAYCHIAHDCQIGDQTVIANGVQLAGHCRIQDQVNLGGSTLVHHFVTIGRLSYIGGASRLRVDVPPFMKIDDVATNVLGVNVVGLKRAGVDDEAIKDLKDMFKRLFRTEDPMSEVIKGAAGESHGPEVQSLLAFMQAREQGRFGRALESNRKGLAT